MPATTLLAFVKLMLSKIMQTQKDKYFTIPFIWWLPQRLRDKESACQYRRHRTCGFNPWVRKIMWRRKWQPTPVMSGKSRGQTSLDDSMGSQRVGYDWARKHTLKIGKTIKTENTLGITRGWGRGTEELSLNADKRVKKIFWKQGWSLHNTVNVINANELYLKMANFMLYISYYNLKSNNLTHKQWTIHWVNCNGMWITFVKLFQTK